MARLVWGASLFLLTLGATAQKPRWQGVDQADFNTAQEKEGRLRYFEAYELYRDVALSQWARTQRDSVHTFDMGMEALDRGVFCALKAGNREGAAQLLDTLIVNGEATIDHWQMRFEVALLQGDDATVAAMLSSDMTSLKGDPAGLKQEALEMVYRRDDLRQTETPADVVRFRPNAKHPEFGALPLNQSVVFVSPGLGMGFGPGTDGWTGMNYNQIGFIQHADSANKAILFGDKLSRRDALGGALKGKFHNGPLALGSDTLIVLTQSFEDETELVEGNKTHHLRLRFFLRGEKDDWSDAVDKTEGWFAFNDPKHNLCHAALDTAGHLIFASDRPGGEGGMDLWRCEWKDGAYTEPVNLGNDINTPGNEVFPFVSIANTLYYSSDGSYGYGGLDVFRQELSGEGKELMGPPVNSTGDDFAIYLNESGIGFLSSDREEGMDRIYTLELRDVYSDFELEYLTCDDEPLTNASLTVLNATTGESWEAKTDAQGKAMITAVIGDEVKVDYFGDEEHLALPTLLLSSQIEGTTTHTQTVSFRPADNEVRVTPANSLTMAGPSTLTFVNRDGSETTLETDLEGWASWGLQEFVACDSVRVSLPGYQSTSLPLRDQAVCPRAESFVVQLKQSVAIDLMLILYDFDKATLRPESKKVLDDIVDYLYEFPNVTVDLGSHTDSRGSDEYNQELSLRRTQSCVEYLVSRGIDPSRIRATGYGETQMENDCGDGTPCPESLHQANRRTIISLGSQ